MEKKENKEIFADCCYRSSDLSHIRTMP